TPLLVNGLPTIAAIATSGFHSLAAGTDGTLWAWGNDFTGELGDRTTGGSRATPAAVTGVTGVVGVAASPSRSFFLKGDGTVWAFGGNAFGYLGDGTQNTQLVPVQLNLSRIVAITASHYNAFALDQDGVVWAWGDNVAGQLGDGTTTARMVPTAISGPGMAWRVSAPTLTPGSGLYSTTQTVTVGCTDPYLPLTLHYTTSGIDPTNGDATVACNATLPVTQSETLKVSAWRPGAPTSLVTAATYTLKVITPTLTLASGTYSTPQPVSMSST